MPYEEAYMRHAGHDQLKNPKKMLEDLAEAKAENFRLKRTVEKLEQQMAQSERGQDEVEEPPVRGADILLDAYALITGPRQAAYAHPTEDYTKVTDIFHALTGIRLSLEQGILFMVSIKLARLRTNMDDGRTHWDSLVDAAGYLGCLGMVWAAENDPWAPYYEKEPGNE